MLLALIVGAALVVLGGVTPRPAHAAFTFTVNSTADTADANLDGICDDGAGNCTLRAAIQEANYGGGADTINFNIPPGSLLTITLTSALPTITEAVTIDGTIPQLPPVPFVELDGSGLDAPGLYITAGNSIVRGLFIHGFIGSGIVLETGGGNLIQDNAIVQNGGYGVRIIDSSNNIVGDPQPNGAFVNMNTLSGNDTGGVLVEGTAENTTIARNTIWANGGSGIVLETGGGNLIQDNVIVQNGGYGVRIIDSSNNIVGDPSQLPSWPPPPGLLGIGNTLSGNDTGGVLVEGTASVANVVGFNNIGLDQDATSPLGNGGNGVTVTDAKTTSMFCNTISANGGSGVYISGADATGNLLKGNIIGADVLGTLDRGNLQDGVRIDGAPDNSVGVPSVNPQTGNIISGNDGAGVHISGDGAEGNKVQNNGIGVQLDLKSPLGNGSHGVWIEDSNNNLVGGTALYVPPPVSPNPPNPWVVPNTLNTIAYNGDAGVFVDDNSNGNGIRANNIYDNVSLGIDVSPPGHSSPFSDRKLTSALWSATPFWIGGKWVPVPLVIATGYIHGGWANTGVAVEAFISSEPDPSGFGEGEQWKAGGDSVPPVPPPFYIDADGNMSAAGSIRSDDTQFVAGKYFTDTVTNVQDGHPQKGTTLEFSNSVEIVEDRDGDGIADGLDDSLSEFSNFFSDATTSDGTTSGNLAPDWPTVDGRNGCLVSVVDLPWPEGVVLGATCSVNPNGTTTGPAHLTVCGGRPLDLPTGTSTSLKCGSADFGVGYGPMFYHGVGTMKATLPSAAKVHFSNPEGDDGAYYEIVNDITSPTMRPVWVGGVLIGPGETATVHDTDLDGMADAYETQHECLLVGTADADWDFDLDGVSNISEAEAGTDPCAAPAAVGGVGGIQEMPDVAGPHSQASTSDGSRIPVSAEVAAAFAAGVVALGVGGWYAKRRWQR
jgi:CSLREA domain-containing protein